MPAVGNGESSNCKILTSMAGRLHQCRATVFGAAIVLVVMYATQISFPVNKVADGGVHVEKREMAVFHTKIPKYPNNWYALVRKFKMNSAIAVKSPGSPEWDKFFLMGQFYKEYINDTMSCCFLLEDSTATKADPSFSNYVKISGHYGNRFFICRYTQRPLPVGVTIVRRTNKLCPTSASSYVLPYFPPPPVSADGLAVCMKSAYDRVDPELIIEWMETQRFLQVDKVVCLVDDGINDASRRVLQYYSDIGYLDYIPYDNREFDPSTGKYTYRNGGLQTITADFDARYRGYKYLAVYDVDEFVIPSRDRSMKQLISDLFNRDPGASGFKMQTTFHMMSWNATGPDDFIITHYQTRTRPLFDAPKNIMRSDRVEYGSVRSHSYNPIAGYPGATHLEADDVLIHHYRTCRTPTVPSAKKEMECFDETIRLEDQQMGRIAASIKDNILKVREDVFGSTERPTVPSSTDS